MDPGQDGTARAAPGDDRNKKKRRKTDAKVAQDEKSGELRFGNSRPQP